jgi:mono/diheme cytochrome c family protein
VKGTGIGVLLAAGLLITSCGSDDKPEPTATSPGASPPGSAQPREAAGDPTKGRQVWLGQCVSCHNTDPSKAGPVGPAVKGSSRALVEARVLHAAYPPGYKPKRDTKIMPPRPDLAASVGDLAAYLRQP